MNSQEQNTVTKKYFPKIYPKPGMKTNNLLIGKFDIKKILNAASTNNRYYDSNLNNLNNFYRDNSDLINEDGSLKLLFGCVDEKIAQQLIAQYINDRNYPRLLLYQIDPFLKIKDLHIITTITHMHPRIAWQLTNDPTWLKNIDYYERKPFSPSLLGRLSAILLSPLIACLRIFKNTITEFLFAMILTILAAILIVSLSPIMIAKSFAKGSILKSIMHITVTTPILLLVATTVFVIGTIIATTIACCRLLFEIIQAPLTLIQTILRGAIYGLSSNPLFNAPLLSRPNCYRTSTLADVAKKYDLKDEDYDQLYRWANQRLNSASSKKEWALIKNELVLRVEKDPNQIEKFQDLLQRHYKDSTSWSCHMFAKGQTNSWRKVMHLAEPEEELFENTGGILGLD